MASREVVTGPGSCRTRSTGELLGGAMCLIIGVTVFTLEITLKSVPPSLASHPVSSTAPLEVATASPVSSDTFPVFPSQPVTRTHLHKWCHSWFLILLVSVGS